MATRPTAIGRLRIGGRLLAILVMLVACVLLFYLCKPFTRHNPVPPFFLGSVAWIAGVRVSRDGERVREGVVFLANHVSWIDILALAGATGTAFVAHSGLGSAPVLRWLCEMNDTVFVARHDRTSVADQVRQVREAIRDTGALTIFPEGTTNDGTALLPFKSSLLSAIDPVPEGIAVQPVLLDYTDAAEIAWANAEPGVANFMRILARRRPVRLRLRFLPPLTEAALSNRKTIAAAAREAIGKSAASSSRT